MKNPIPFSRRVFLGGLLSALALTSHAADFKKPVTQFTLEDGDTIVFLGDSITHQCLYTQYLEDYYFTRYPDRVIHFHNAGVSGDKAAQALDRFPGDVAPMMPKVVTVLLGMNDGSYQHFNHDIFHTYEKDMTELAGRLEGIGATTIFMGPTMYDARVAEVKPPRWLKNQEQIADARKYYNALLAFYGTWARDMAIDRGAGYVDLLGPLNLHTTQKRLEDPEFTMIPDAVHPDANGHAVMAFEVLEQMNANRSVGSVTATWTAGKWVVAAGNGKASEVSGDLNRLTFTHLAGALPWVLPPEAAIGYEVTKSGHKMSNERLVVRGLQPGRYRVSIDGQEVGVYTHAALGAKVELQSNEKTPQYQQALQVALLNKERNEKAVRNLRNQWGGRKGRLSRGLDKSDPEGHAKWLKEFEAKVAEFRSLADEYAVRIRQLAQPVPHVYTIEKVTGKP